MLLGEVILTGAAAALNRATAANVANLAAQLSVSTLPFDVEGEVSLALLSSRALELIGRLEEAEEVARQALDHAQKLPDRALLDRIEVQLAILCRARGESAEAIARLRAVIESQKSHGAEVEAASTELELGAALRDATGFHEALALYERLWARRGLPPFLIARTANQIAVVQKNILQTLLDDGNAAQADEEKLRHLERSVLCYLDEASIIAESQCDAALFAGTCERASRTSPRAFRAQSRHHS